MRGRRDSVPMEPRTNDRHADGDLGALRRWIDGQDSALEEWLTGGVLPIHLRQRLLRDPVAAERRR